MTVHNRSRADTMTTPYSLAGTIAILMSLHGCGSSSNSPVAVSPRIAAKPDVVIAIDGEKHTCLVALASEEQGSAVACSDVVSFARDELRVPKGAIYNIRTVAHVEAADVAKVAADLNGAGYRFIGGTQGR
jgi:hypothetical protein